jgi:hypothetical protein
MRYVRATAILAVIAAGCTGGDRRGDENLVDTTATSRVGDTTTASGVQTDPSGAFDTTAGTAVTNPPTADSAALSGSGASPDSSGGGTATGTTTP